MPFIPCITEFPEGPFEPENDSLRDGIPIGLFIRAEDEPIVSPLPTDDDSSGRDNGFLSSSLSTLMGELGFLPMCV